MDEEPDFIARSADEIEILLLDYLPKDQVGILMLQIIPIIGQLARSAMEDIADRIKEIITDETKDRTH
jgi:hypothetical protein